MHSVICGCRICGSGGESQTGCSFAAFPLIVHTVPQLDDSRINLTELPVAASLNACPLSRANVGELSSFRVGKTKAIQFPSLLCCQQNSLNSHRYPMIL